jgi:hypothetical protein
MGFVKINRRHGTIEKPALSPPKLALSHILREYLQPDP